MKTTLLPSNLAAHPLVLGRTFYTVPKELLAAVVETIGESHFDASALQLEQDLSRINGDHSSQIGFQNGGSIHYDLVGNPKPLGVAMDEISEADWASIGLDGSFARNRSVLKTLDGYRDWIRGVCRGYCGWLASNKRFVNEQRQLLREWRVEFSCLGFGEPPALRVPATLAPIAASPQRLAEFAAARREFLKRWQLLNIAGPFLPDPVRTMVPMLESTSLVAALSMGTRLFLADIFPLPDRKMLRGMMEDALKRRSPPPHLAPWIELVQGDNPGKKAIARYGRMFLLQHFWRALYSRHAAAFHTRVGKLRDAFASYLFPCVSEAAAATALRNNAESLRKDLSEIAKVRGPHWFDRTRAKDGTEQSY